MACCTETYYNLLLTLEPWQKNSVIEQTQIQLGLQKTMRWNETKSKVAVEWATIQEHFLLKRGKVSDITNLSLKLAEHRVPHKVTLSKR